MTNEELGQAFANITTPQIADACVRLKIPVRVAPVGIKAIVYGQRLAGRARPARHYGSVDVFLEALVDAEPGDVFVVDNDGRTDEGCIGDLIVIECQEAGIAGLVIWGTHRDTAEIQQLGLPVFSYGACLAGPLRLDEREKEALVSAQFDTHLITRDDVVFADIDGVIFVPHTHVAEIIQMANEVAAGERDQVRLLRQGQTLRRQFQFEDYLARRQADPTYTFRAHLRQLNRFIEE